MVRGKHTIEDKQDLLKNILRILRLQSNPEYFSRGGTVTARGLKSIRDELYRLIQTGNLTITER